MSVTGKQILHAIKKTKAFNPNWQAPQKKAMEKYLEKELPDELKNLLAQKATAKLIVEAQLAHNRRFLKAKMPRKMLCVGFSGDPMLDKRIAAVESMLQDVVDKLDEFVKNFDQLLKQHGLQERDYLQTLPLNSGIAAKILKRKITIGELLIIQPEIFLLFSAK